MLLGIFEQRQILPHGPVLIFLPCQRMVQDWAQPVWQKCRRRTGLCKIHQSPLFIEALSEQLRYLADNQKAQQLFQALLSQGAF